MNKLSAARRPAV